MALKTLPFFFTLPRGSRSLVCVSFKNLFIHFVLKCMFRKVSQTSLRLEKAGLDSGFSPTAQAWIPGSPLPRACQVEVEAAGQSEL